MRRICVRCGKREQNNLRKHLLYSGFLDKAFPVMELITSDMILCTPFGNEETTGSLILDFQGPVLKFHLGQSLIDTGHANTSFIALHNFCKSCNSSINRDIIAEIWYSEKVPVIEDLLCFRHWITSINTLNY